LYSGRTQIAHGCVTVLAAVAPLIFGIFTGGGGEFLKNLQENILQTIRIENMKKNRYLLT